jgi:hypothetical protein
MNPGQASAAHIEVSLRDVSSEHPIKFMLDRDGTAGKLMAPR